MPIYTYECPKCHKQVDLEQKISAKQAPLCFEEGCDTETFQVIGKSSFVLKGGGWAKDGYGSKR